MLRGLDASAVQGALPIDALATAGHRFLFHKCQQGNDGKDPLFEENVAAARAAGFYVGAYHFLYPLPHLDPVEQAELFFRASTLGAARGELPPAFDLEWPDPDRGWAKWKCTPKQISDWSQKCLERVEQLWGVVPIVYEYPYFHGKLAAGADVSWLERYRLWIAAYGPKPVVLSPWKDWTFWQNDGDGGEKLPNGRDADFDWFNGTEDDLAALAGLGRGGPVDVVEGPAAIRPAT